MKDSTSSRNRIVAYSAMFAAFYALGRLIPFSAFIGAPGFVPFSNSFILVYALLLGPVAGSLSAVIGTIISFFLGKAPIFLGLDFLTPLAGVLVAGLVVRRKRLWAVFVAFAALLVVFNLSPLTLTFVSVPYIGAVPWTWLHLVAIAALAGYGILVKAPVSATMPLRKLVVLSGAASFIGLLFQQLVGDLLYEVIFGVYGVQGSAAWFASWRLDFFEYPFEWISFTLISVVLAVPVYLLVSKRLRVFES